MIQTLILFSVVGFTSSAMGADANLGNLNEAMNQVRDPFKRIVIISEKMTPKTELEYYSLDQYKMLGVISGPNKVRAMVAAPNGKTYFVSEKMKLGTQEGFVKKITPNAIIVREKFVNVLGQDEQVDTEIRLAEKGGKK